MAVTLRVDEDFARQILLVQKILNNIHKDIKFSIPEITSKIKLRVLFFKKIKMNPKKEKKFKIVVIEKDGMTVIKDIDLSKNEDRKKVKQLINDSWDFRPVVIPILPLYLRRWRRGKLILPTKWENVFQFTPQFEHLWE